MMDHFGEWRFRPATMRDAAAVCDLFKAHLQAMGVQPDAELDADMDGFPRAYEGQGNLFCVVETKDGRLIGMGGILSGTIRRIHVDRAWRGQGIGRQVIRYLLAHGSKRPGATIQAIVARSNSAAQRVFMACGFRATGRTPAQPKMQETEIYELTS